MSELNTDALRAGTLLAGKYRVEKVLGEGGMGVVVAAKHVYLQEHVAVKLLRGDRAQVGTSAERLIREARAASRIRSEHVARVFDVGLLEDGSPYIVMERLRGRDLAVLLEKDGPLPPATAVDYLLQACEAMAEAHRLGIVHRDLKPANLFLTRRVDGSPCVKVLDFGISKMSRTPREARNSDSPPESTRRRWDAKTADPDERTSREPVAAPTPPPHHARSVGLTGTNARVGSPRYMSPEQVRGHGEVDERADVWALATILYELVTGVPAFVGATQEDLENAILGHEPAPIAQLRRGVPRGLEAVLAACMRKDPSTRTADVASLACELAPFGSTAARASAGRIARIVAMDAASTEDDAAKPDVFAVSQAQPLRGRRRLTRTVLATGAGVAAALTVSTAWLGRSPAVTDPSPATLPHSNSTLPGPPPADPTSEHEPTPTATVAASAPNAATTS